MTHDLSITSMSDRRRFLAGAGTTAASVARGQAVRADSPRATSTVPRRGAEHCILLWLGGGASHIDTWDPKRVSSDGVEDAGSAYAAIDTAIPDVQVCEHLHRTAALLDRCVPIRSMCHDVVDEHAAATYRMHTGRPTSGTVVYPSIGSVVSALKGSISDLIPSYVLIGNPSPARESGFLGAEHSCIYLTETESGPRGLTRPARITDVRQRRRIDLLRELQDRYAHRHPDDTAITETLAASERGFRLAGPEFMDVFNLNREPSSLRLDYGDEFGQRCLLARRLIERGTRLVEVSFNLNFSNGTGWDTHREGHLRQHLLIQSLDRAFSTLLRDLEAKRLLDRTLVVVSTEFGRPATFDDGGGRGHHAAAFSVVLAGGGLNTGRAVGTTDESGMSIVDGSVSVPDLFATIYAALGIEAYHLLYADDRPVPVTDGGNTIEGLFG